MKTTIRYVVGLVLLFVACLPAGAKESSLIGQKLAEFSLSDFRGKSYSFAEISQDRKLVVVAFLGTECPLAKLYGRRLADLAREFQGRGVAFVGINPNSQDSITEIAAYARQHGIEFPMLKDAGNRVADAWGAQRTPEIFVVDTQRTVRYHGRVDDQWGIGYSRDVPKRADLRIALDELLANKTVSQPETPVPGCLIGRARQPDSQSTVTYSKQISRLLNQRCVECHRPGEIAPFSLTNFDEASAWADMIGEVVADGRMPPWHADPKHGRFAGSRDLSAEEKKLIRDWVAAGAPQGNPADLPEAPVFGTAGWQLPREPDAVFTMSNKPYKVPAQGTVRYQFFMAEAEFKEEKWISAMEVLPGNRAVVHHALVFVRARGDNNSQLEEGGERGFLAAYVPGLRAAPFPDGMAKRIPAGAKLVFQLHYTPVGVEQEDLTKVGFIFADPKSVKYEVRTVSAIGRPLRIPAGAENHRVDAKSTAAPTDVLLLAMMPHLHLRGKAFRYEVALPGGKRETLLDIPHYDFNWQTAYRPVEPLLLPKGSQMFCTAHYDNSENNLNNPDPTKVVGWGPQTWDEMMIGYFDIAFRRPDDSAESTSTTASTPAPAKKETPRFDTRRLFDRLDKNSDGKLTRDEVPERSLKLFDRLDADRSGDLTREEVSKLTEFLPNGL